MHHDAGDALTITENCEPVLGALLLKIENVSLVVTNVMKKFVPCRANLVLPPAPHCF